MRSEPLLSSLCWQRPERCYRRGHNHKNPETPACALALELFSLFLFFFRLLVVLMVVVAFCQVRFSSNVHLRCSFTPIISSRRAWLLLPLQGMPLVQR